MKFLLIALWGASLTVMAYPGSVHERCGSGVMAFSKTLHPLLRRDCLPCHDEKGSAPVHHAVEDSNRSYSQVIPFVRWEDIDNSRFVKWGGNRHCLQHGGNCTTTEEDLKPLIQAWWEQGQKACPPAGKYFTRPLVIDEKVTTEFRSFIWSFPDLPKELSDVYLQVQMRKSSLRRRQPVYQFRKPRLIANGIAIEIRKLRILVNGTPEPWDTPFDHVKAKINPVDLSMLPPVLSSHTVTVRQKGELDLISFSVDELRAIPSFRCADMKRFEDEVGGVLAFRDCYYCHGGGPYNHSGKAEAKRVLRMDLERPNLCTALWQLGSGVFSNDSPLIAYPLRGSQGHPIVFPNHEEILPIWNFWIQNEGG